MDTLPLSEEGQLLVSVSDFSLVNKGLKTCTSRYGVKDFTVGQQVEIKNNVSGDSLTGQVTEVIVKTLNEVTEQEANAIGDYGIADHVLDFTAVYRANLGRPVSGDTELTLIFFKV